MPPSLYNSLLERLEGRQYSNYFACYCPFDSHTSPAMLVFDDGMVKCLSCNKIWSHAQLDKKIGSHFIQTQKNNTVSKVLPQWRRWEDEYGSLEGIADAAHRSLKRHSAFQTYFKKRKIYEYIDEGNLGYIDGWIIFPVYNQHRQVDDIVVRSSSSKSSTRYVVSPSVGGTHSLYCPDWKQVQQSSIVYVVYGIIDAISLHLAGLPVVTGITGKSLSPELLRPLNKRFIIVPDADEDREAHILKNKLGWKCSVKKIDYEENCKDPDDVRRKFGNQYLLQAIGA